MIDRLPLSLSILPEGSLLLPRTLARPRRSTFCPSRDASRAGRKDCACADASEFSSKARRVLRALDIRVFGESFQMMTSSLFPNERTESERNLRLPFRQEERYRVSRRNVSSEEEEMRWWIRLYCELGYGVVK